MAQLVATTVVGILSALIFMVWSLFGSKKWDPRGKHCFVTGGSSGLGLALALLLTKRGADVSIVARNQDRLDAAIAQMEKHRTTPNQILRAYSFSVNNATGAAAALQAASEPHGPPDAHFLCAGTATPGFFIEETEESTKNGMENGYWTQAWSALAAAKHMAKDHSPGKIIFVSSLLGYMSYIGYSTYSPAKHALRGLAETLRQELLLYSVDVHIYFPGTILSPGYDEENKTKPAVTLELEKTDDGLRPDQAAEALLKGVVDGRFHISDGFLGNVFRTSTLGATPHNNVFIDTVYSLIGWIALPIWRQGVDRAVLKHRKEHHDYLSSKGFFATDTNHT